MRWGGNGIGSNFLPTYQTPQWFRFVKWIFFKHAQRITSPWTSRSNGLRHVLFLNSTTTAILFPCLCSKITGSNSLQNYNKKVNLNQLLKVSNSYSIIDFEGLLSQRQNIIL